MIAAKRVQRLRLTELTDAPLRTRLIRLSLRALATMQARRFTPETPESAGIVVTLHHVEPSRLTRFRPNAHLSVTPDFLDGFIRHSAANGWQFVPVSELIGPDAGHPKRIAVTLDDAYRDNFEHAWPIFKRHSVPFAIYVCPGFCDATAELWWEALERVVAGNEFVSLPGSGPPELPARNLPEKRRAFRNWADWLTDETDEDQQRQAIRALATRYGVDLAALARELIMDWDQVRTIAADPLCAIGAHTMTHPALARLTAERALAEMRDSADRIAAEIGVRPTTIAFPYGYLDAAGAREAELAAEAGFSGSFTTRPGFVPKAGSRHGLLRLSLNGLYQNLDLIDVLLNPGLWKLRSQIADRFSALRGRGAASR